MRREHGSRTVKLPRGVSYDKTHRGCKKYKTRVFFGGRDRFIGRFETADEASRAYQQAAACFNRSPAEADDPDFLQRVRGLVQAHATPKPCSVDASPEQSQHGPDQPNLCTDGTQQRQQQHDSSLQLPSRNRPPSRAMPVQMSRSNSHNNSQNSASCEYSKHFRPEATTPAAAALAGAPLGQLPSQSNARSTPGPAFGAKRGGPSSSSNGQAQAQAQAELSDQLLEELMTREVLQVIGLVPTAKQQQQHHTGARRLSSSCNSLPTCVPPQPDLAQRPRSCTPQLSGPPSAVSAVLETAAANINSLANLLLLQQHQQQQQQSTQGAQAQVDLQQLLGAFQGQQQQQGGQAAQAQDNLQQLLCTVLQQQQQSTQEVQPQVDLHQLLCTALQQQQQQSTQEAQAQAELQQLLCTAPQQQQQQQRQRQSTQEAEAQFDLQQLLCGALQGATQLQHLPSVAADLRCDQTVQQCCSEFLAATACTASAGAACTAAACTATGCTRTPQQQQQQQQQQQPCSSTFSGHPAASVPSPPPLPTSLAATAAAAEAADGDAAAAADDDDPMDAAGGLQRQDSMLLQVSCSLDALLYVAAMVRAVLELYTAMLARMFEDNAAGDLLQWHAALDLRQQQCSGVNSIDASVVDVTGKMVHLLVASMAGGASPAAAAAGSEGLEPPHPAVSGAGISPAASDASRVGSPSISVAATPAAASCGTAAAAAAAAAVAAALGDAAAEQPQPGGDVDMPAGAAAADADAGMGAGTDLTAAAPLVQRAFVMGVLERLKSHLVSLHGSLQQQVLLGEGPCNVWEGVQQWMQLLQAQAVTREDFTAVRLAALL